MKAIFDTYVDNAFGEHKQALFKIRQFEINYKRFFPMDKVASILDIGIGRGEMLTCMNNWGYSNYLGVDISPSTITFCKSLGLNCMQVDDTTALLKENDNSFDLITLLDVLEHVKKENTIDFLNALNGSLKEGGVLIIQVPNSQAPDGQLHRYNDITHEVGYVEHSLQQVLIAAGFDKVEFKGFEEFVLGGWKESIKKYLRYFYWQYIKLTRTITGNLNPGILNPVFFAIVRK